MKRMLTLGVCAALLSGIAQGAPEIANPTPELLDRVRQNIQALRDALNNTQEARRDVRLQLASIEQKIAATVKQIRTTRSDVILNTRRVQELLSQRKQLQLPLEKQRDVLAQQMRAAYAVGRQDYVKMLVNQEQPMRVGRMLAYYAYLDTARRERIVTLAEKIAVLEKIEQSIADENEALTALTERLTQEKTNLLTMQAERRTLLVNIDQDLTDKTQRLVRLGEDEKRLAELLQKLQNQFSDIPSNIDGKGAFARLRGKLPWPAPGSMAVAFGVPRGTGNWQGVVLRAAEGVEVRAVWRGRVAFAGWLNGYGLIMVIEHGDGYMSVYGYNQSLVKDVGDWTEAGEVIAIVGDSGGQQDAGLYFEIRHNGKPDNPVKWCVRRVASVR